MNISLSIPAIYYLYVSGFLFSLFTSFYPSHHLHQRMIYFGVIVYWKKARGSWTNMKHHSMRSVTIELSHDNKWRPPVWNAGDYRKEWLETLSDVTQNRSQLNSLLSFQVSLSFFSISVFYTFYYCLYYSKYFRICLAQLM